MKDLKRLLIYGSSAGLMVLVLAMLGRSDAISGGVKVSLALILVVSYFVRMFEKSMRTDERN